MKTIFFKAIESPVILGILTLLLFWVIRFILVKTFKALSYFNSPEEDEI